MKHVLRLLNGERGMEYIRTRMEILMEKGKTERVRKTERNEEDDDDNSERKKWLKEGGYKNR